MSPGTHHGIAGRVINALEIMGGARPLPERWAGRPIAAVLIGAWWVLLLLAAFAFMGRNVKFIYIDF